MDFSAQFVSCLARSGEAVCQAPNGIGSFQLFAESAFGYYPQTLWLESSSFTPFLGDSTWRQLVRIYRKQEGSLDGTNGYGNRQRGYYQNCIQNLAIFGHEPTHCKLEYMDIVSHGKHGSLSKKTHSLKQLQVRMETGGLCAACGMG